MKGKRKESREGGEVERDSYGKEPGRESLVRSTVLRRKELGGRVLRKKEREVSEGMVWRWVWG